MKSLTPAYFAAGTTGLFAMALAAEGALLAGVPSMQASLMLALLAAALGSLLTWLSQLRRRYAGSGRLLWAFATLGLVVLGLCIAINAGLAGGAALQAASSVAGLALIGLFCLVALHTRPASEQGEGVL